MCAPRFSIRATSASSRRPTGCPIPTWRCSPTACRCVVRGPEQGYKITPAQLEAAITPRTKLMFLNSPSNPTGAAYTKAELQALGAVLAKHPQIVIASDEMYEHIYWAAEPFTSFAQANPGSMTAPSPSTACSKAYAMTGWRIGYCGAQRNS
jgi:aspartate aminotransferase